MPVSAAEIVAWAMANPVNAALLQRLPRLGLPQCFLTAGCLFQAAWNRRSGLAPETAVKDYDVFYFDDRDLSWEAEDAVIQDVAALCADLGVAVEVRNQARVHLWYRQRFGGDYPQLRSATDGIDRYLVQCTCLGIEVATGRLYAPNGLEDMVAGVLRPNPLNPSPALFRAKAESYQARWPWLTIAE
ncbi:nucleotidyltransferase family protein [Inquilinus sp.]|uniref:nucleotidyltransferase family protein n=1 Tax=Inquilinus sp. TaxID=1932117 RepID=UPI0031DDA8E0